jgi:hypothetical protein
MKRNILATTILLLACGCAANPVNKRTRTADSPPLRTEEQLILDLGDLRTPAKAAQKNEDVLIGPKEGLQSHKEGLFAGVQLGKHGDPITKYLWTIDDRGVNIVLERTPFNTPRGWMTHTNISSRARFAGEAWFTSPHEVVLNGHSGRFGDRAAGTDKQYKAAVEYWERLGYEVTEIALGWR